MRSTNQRRPRVPTVYKISWGCGIKRLKKGQIREGPLTSGAFEIRRAPNVKFGGKFAFLIGHPVFHHSEHWKMMIFIPDLRSYPHGGHTGTQHGTADNMAHWEPIRISPEYDAKIFAGIMPTKVTELHFGSVVDLNFD